MGMLAGASVRATERGRLVHHGSLQRWPMNAAIEPLLDVGIRTSHGPELWTQQHSGRVEVGDGELFAVNVRLA